MGFFQSPVDRGSCWNPGSWIRQCRQARLHAERPKTLVSAVLDYVERRETFIVGRQSGIINP